MSLQRTVPCRSGTAGRLPSWLPRLNHKRSFLRSTAISVGNSNSNSSGSSDSGSTHHRDHPNSSINGWVGHYRNLLAFPASIAAAWNVWPPRVAHRMQDLRARVHPGSSTSKSSSRHSLIDRLQKARISVEAALLTVERPARIGLAAAATTTRMTVQLTGSVLQLIVAVYMHLLGPRFRRFFRFLFGIPFLLGTLYLLQMKAWNFPEVGSGLDTSCVADLPLCHTVEEAMDAAARLQHRYHDLLRAWRDREAAETVLLDTEEPPKLRGSAPTLVLTREEENELLGAIFVLIRSIETQIVGTAEERVLITPHPDVVRSVAPLRRTWRQPTAADTAAAAVNADTVTATPDVSDSSSNATAASTILISPAEYMLRVVMAISISQGWSDITEHTGTLFQELVRTKAPPVQSRIVQAVGELCSLSYELESGKVDAITLSQRKRIASAIDAFRPERSVDERCTIAHEITILPLPDSNRTTRCLGLIRKSPGRKPQLILCFVGSNSKRNWVTNFNYWPVPLPERYGVVGALLPGNSEATAQPYAHRGFLELVQTISYKEVAADFDHILLVGHSLGGALAQLAGLELAAERPSRRITVITMASPRTLALDATTTRAIARERLAQSTGAALLRKGFPPHAGSKNEEQKGEPRVQPPSDRHERDPLADMLMMPANYHHFRGYIQPDVVPHLPPEFVGFTHSGQRIPLNTGCTTSLSFMGWGMYSKLYHNADLYRRALRQPMVAQTHWYVGDSNDAVDAEEYIQVPV